MDSANESMYEDSRNKIPPSFRNSLSNFPFGEKEGIVYLILSESHFPKARSCRESTSCAILQEKKKKRKKKKRIGRITFKNLLKDQRLIYLSLLFGNIFSLNRVLSEGYTLNHDRTKEEVDKF